MDQDVINLAKAIREKESGGNFDAVGDAGTSKGGYQWQPETWKEHSKKTFGKVVEMTPDNQNAVAYKTIKTWKDQGLNPAQIAAKWNSGSHVGWENKRGYNAKIGLKYDVPAYVADVTARYQRIKGETISAQSQPEIPVEQPKKPLIERVAGGLDSVFGGGKIGEFIGTKIAKNSKSGQELAQQEQSGQVPEGTTDETFKTPSALQIGGDVLKVGTTFMPVGRSASAVTKVAGKVLPKATAKFVGNVGTGAATGAMLDVAENLRDEKPLELGTGTVVGAAIPAIGPLLKGAGIIGREALGMTTGTSRKTLEEFQGAIARGGESAKAATQAMRGKISADDIVTEAGDALDQIIKQRGDEYSSRLATLKTSTKTFEKTPIIEKFNKMLDDFGVTFTEKGIPDFTRSPGLNRYKTDLVEMSKIIDSWGTKEGDLTLVGMDKLKQAIGDFRRGTPDSKKFDAFVTALSNDIKGLLKNEPGYLDMLKGYESSSNLIKEIRKGLSLTDKAQVDTSFKKLISVFRTNNDIRERLVQELDDISGGTLIPKIAGGQLSELTPRGLIGKLGLGGAGGVAITGGTGLIPLLGYMLTASPRFIGELSRVLGLGQKGIQALKKILLLGGVNQFNISPGDVLMNKMKGNVKPDYQIAPMLKLIDEAKKSGASKMDIVK